MCYANKKRGADELQESRLFQIIYYLLDKGHATAPELAQQFEVSVRTIYRDINALSAAGVPIYTETGRNGGIHVLDGFVLEKVALSDQEKQEILTALQSLSAVNQHSGHNVLQKLSALFDLHTDSWLEVDFSCWGNDTQDQQKFAVLKNAMIYHHLLAITYVGSNGSWTSRKIKPLKLLYKSGAWYVKAYCMEKQDFRVFKINRIIEVQCLEETFLPLVYPEQEKTCVMCQCKFILRFTAQVAYRVYDEFAATQIERQQSGDLLVHAELPKDEWLLGYFLSYGAQVEILEPVSFRKIMAERAREIYETYEF